jgi:hypothetical protein
MATGKAAPSLLCWCCVGSDGADGAFSGANRYPLRITGLAEQHGQDPEQNAARQKQDKKKPGSMNPVQGGPKKADTITFQEGNCSATLL